MVCQGSALADMCIAIVATTEFDMTAFVKILLYCVD